jgi:hypothetical protein
MSRTDDGRSPGLQVNDNADLPSFPVIMSGAVSLLTVAGAATASAFWLAPCSLLIPDGNHRRYPNEAFSLRQTAAARLAPPRSQTIGFSKTILFERGALDQPLIPKIGEIVSQNSLLITLSQKLILQSSCER